MEINTSSLDCISLSNDILSIIFSMVSVKDLCVLSVVSRRFYMVTKSVWNDPAFDNLENRQHIAKIYGKCVMNPETLMSMGATLELNVNDELKNEFFKITAPLILNESIAAACNTFTLKELSALTKLYCSEIGSSITAKTNLYITTFQRNSSTKIIQAMHDFEEKHQQVINPHQPFLV